MLAKILQSLQDLFAPKRCYGCRSYGSFFCQHCATNLGAFPSVCYHCKRPSQNFRVHLECREERSYEGVYIWSYYHFPLIQRLIKEGKYYGKKEIFSEIAEHMSYGVKKYTHKEENIVVLSVPMHPLRKFKRGYNHSHILAKHLSEILQLPYEEKCILRKKNSRQQSKLSRTERQRNLQDTFKIDEKKRDKLDNTTCILVDDVVSTGSTFEEISKLLKQSGAHKVLCVAIASD